MVLVFYQVKATFAPRFHAMDLMTSSPLSKSYHYVSYTWTTHVNTGIGRMAWQHVSCLSMLKAYVLCFVLLLDSPRPSAFDCAFGLGPEPFRACCSAHRSENRKETAIVLAGSKVCSGTHRSLACQRTPKFLRRLLRRHTCRLTAYHRQVKSSAVSACKVCTAIRATGSLAPFHSRTCTQRCGMFASTPCGASL